MLEITFLHITLRIGWHANNIMAASNEGESSISTQLTRQIEDLSINTDDLLTICANCGKEGTNMNTCNKCKAATYCNASCKKKHRSKHKQDCERRVAELHDEELERKRRAAELHDEKLFKPPPPAEDCPICFLLLPAMETGRKYHGCCGKIICSGCIHAMEKRDEEEKCPFCRVPTQTTYEEQIKRAEKRMGLGDAEAIYSMGCCYSEGSYGLPQNRAKALELFHRAGEVGHARAYFNIGLAYNKGNGVERNENKANHYWDIAAIGGHIMARNNLAVLEWTAGNLDRALKHFLLAAGGGSKTSLSAIQEMFKRGVATKEDYTQALRAYQAYLGEIKSVQRNEAAAFNDGYKYYEA